MSPQNKIFKPSLAKPIAIVVVVVLQLLPRLYSLELSKV